MLGTDNGMLRLPLYDPSDANKARIKAALESVNLL